MMEERILEFIRDLRKAEVRVSPTEAIDAIAAVETVGLEDLETFRSALAATLCKDSRDIPTFNRLFTLYFMDLETLGEGLKEKLGREDPWVQELLRRLLSQDGLNLDPATYMMLLGRGPAMEIAIRGGGANVGMEQLFFFLQVGYFSRRIWDSFDWEQVEEDLSKILEALAAQGLDVGELARIRSYMELRLDAFRQMIRSHVRRELERRAYKKGEQLRMETLSEKSLFTLTPDEVAQMRAVVARLSRKIKDALARRQRKEQRGKLDSKRTFRKNLQYGGVPVELRWRRRIKDKPKLVTLCDVSDSVRNASRFMLQLVWSLQDCFAKVRSYVFVSEIAEVSDFFATYPIDKAMDHALRGAKVDYHSRSDFGYAFRRFIREHLDVLDKKTTVVIMGDARNNYNDPQVWAIKLIRERAKGIIWMNPEGKWGWGVGDSVMPLYDPHCDLVRECRTLDQLARVVDGLASGWWRRSPGARKG